MINFSDPKYKEKALSIEFNEDKVISPYDAFMVLIHDIDYERLDNLVKILSIKLNVSLEEAYLFTQDLDLNIETKKIILATAYEVLKDNSLGNVTTLDGKFNLSSFLGHSLYMGKCASVLAHLMGVNSDVALSLGILHDYGRKYDHRFNHVIVGFEKLIDIGYENEAIGTLTHSYIHGKVCANNERAYAGFFVDDYGNEHINGPKDDIMEFLEHYNFSLYDGLLNIADLSATSYGVTNIWDRLEDIATRRAIDPVNRKYFICELINLLNEYLYSINAIDSYTVIKPRKELSLDDAYDILKTLANRFEVLYKSFEKEVDNLPKRV